MMHFLGLSQRSQSLDETIISKARRIALDIEIVDVVSSQGPNAKRGNTAASGLLHLPLTGQDVSFGSTAERNFLLSCRLDHQITEVRAQPFSIVFKRSNWNKDRRYTPDYHVKKELSLGATRLCVGRDTASEIAVEVKREADLHFTVRKSIERIAAGIAWSQTKPVNDFSFFIEPILPSDIDRHVKRFGLLANEPATIASQKFKRCLRIDKSMSYEEAVKFLLSSGNSEDQSIHAVLIGIAKGWAETDTLKQLNPSDLIRWNPNARNV